MGGHHQCHAIWMLKHETTVNQEIYQVSLALRIKAQFRLFDKQMYIFSPYFTDILCRIECIKFIIIL